MNDQSSRSTNIASRFLAAPLELQAFAIFSVIVSVLDLASNFLGPKDVREAIVPVTGWVGSMGYMFSIFFIFLLILTPVPNWRSIRRAIITMLLISMVSGIIDLVRAPGTDFGNPYLTVSPWRPLWTLVLPAVWIAVLYSPRVRKFSDGRVAQNAGQPAGDR